MKAKLSCISFGYRFIGVCNQRIVLIDTCLRVLTIFKKSKKACEGMCFDM